MVFNSDFYYKLINNGVDSVESLMNLSKCSRATAYRVFKLVKEKKSLENRPRSGRKPKLTTDVFKKVTDMIRKDSKISTRKMSQRLEKRNIVKVSYSTICRALKSKCYFSKLLVVPSAAHVR